MLAGAASGFVLVTGLGLVAYFVEAHASGIRTAIAEGSLELAMVVASLLGLVLVTQVVIADLATRSRSSSRHRRLVRRALEIDYGDASALREFDAVPDLRELVAMLMAEKRTAHELGDRMDAVHGGLDSMLEGMRRSAVDLDMLREEGLDEPWNAVAGLWNGLVERAREAAAARAASAAEGAAAAADGLETLARRIDVLEEELARVRALVAAGPAAASGSAAAPPAGAARETAAAPGLELPWEFGHKPVPASVLVQADEPSLEEHAVRARPAADWVPAANAKPWLQAAALRSTSDRIGLAHATPDDVLDLPASALLYDPEPRGERQGTDRRAHDTLEFET